MTAADVLALRAEVLRPGQPLEASAYPTDDHPATGHFGGWDGDDLVAVASVALGRFQTDVRTRVDWTPTWRLRGMAVAADRRGQGLGGEVLEAVHRHVEDSGHDGLWANARLPAVPFYERHGWRVVSEEFEIPSIGPHHVMVRRTPPV